MRKFTVKSVKGEVIIYELEVRIVRSMDKEFLINLNPGEYQAFILKPESFHMKRERMVEGKKEVYHEPDVWCWHALNDTYEEALVYAGKLVEQEFAFNLRKYGKQYTDVDVAAALMSIKLQKLPGSDFMTDAEKLKLNPSEFAQKAKEAGHDSLGLCSYPDLDPTKEV